MNPRLETSTCRYCYFTWASECFHYDGPPIEIHKATQLPSSTNSQPFYATLLPSRLDWLLLLSLYSSFGWRYTTVSCLRCFLVTIPCTKVCPTLGLTGTMVTRPLQYVLKAVTLVWPSIYGYQTVA
jgi:hypothetical protein